MATLRLTPAFLRKLSGTRQCLPERQSTEALQQGIVAGDGTRDSGGIYSVEWDPYETELLAKELWRPRRWRRQQAASSRLGNS